MKKIIQFFFLAVLSINVHAKEIITLASFNSPSGSLYTYYLKILQEANSLQDRYEFILESKPGAQGLLAIQYQDQSPKNRIAVVAPAFVELINSKQINKDDYVPISSQGEACWVLVSSVGDASRGVASLKGQKDLTVGIMGYGSSMHITALELGEKYGFKVTPVLFKSHFEALTLMASDGSINLTSETPEHYLALRDKNPKMQALAITCSVRNPKMPYVKTLKEQGFNTPTIWLFAIANNKMPKEKRDEIGKIFDQSMLNLGQKQIFNFVDFSVPIFQKISVAEHYTSSIQQNNYFRQKYRDRLGK